MHKTTIKKVNYREIVKIGKRFRIQWNKQPLMITDYDDDGNPIGEHEDPIYVTCMEETYSYKPEIEEIKDLINGYYNTEINNEIITGYTYSPESGVTLHPYLSNENQMNYKNAYDAMKDALLVQSILPYTIKNSNGYEPLYYDFTTTASFKEFYVGIVSYINSKIHEAWGKKDSVDWSKYIYEEDENDVKMATVMDNTVVPIENSTGETENNIINEINQ